MSKRGFEDVSQAVELGLAPQRLVKEDSSSVRQCVCFGARRPNQAPPGNLCPCSKPRVPAEVRVVGGDEAPGESCDPSWLFLLPSPRVMGYLHRVCLCVCVCVESWQGRCAVLWGAQDASNTQAQQASFCYRFDVRDPSCRSPGAGRGILWGESFLGSSMYSGNPRG